MKYRVIGVKVTTDTAATVGRDEIVVEAESREQAEQLFYDDHTDTSTSTWFVDDIIEEE